MQNIIKKTFKASLLLLFLISVLFTTNVAHSKELITDGKGIWVNIWNYPENPDLYCEYMKSKGVDTIWLQISRSTTAAIVHPKKLNQILKSAHARKIKVIGWTYPYLNKPNSDARKFIYAAKYKTPDGDMLDALAADIEETTNARAIQTFSNVLRRNLGPDYPLIAITFSPVLKRAEPSHYAWKTVGANFDILAPMTYWTAYKKYRSQQGAYNFTALTIKRLKEYTGNSNVKIHLIGDAQKTSNSEISGFIKAAKDHGIQGISLYPWHKPTPSQVTLLGKTKI